MICQGTLAIAAFGFFFLLSPEGLRADGCYICSGQPNTYVKYSGDDSGAKRTAAQNCGCTVSGTTSSCNAANYKILCTVQAQVPNQSLMAVKAPACRTPQS